MEDALGFILVILVVVQIIILGLWVFIKHYTDDPLLKWFALWSGFLAIGASAGALILYET
jgi:hypothetical protein